jgi:hypothetical protein
MSMSENIVVTTTRTTTNRVTVREAMAKPPHLNIQGNLSITNLKGPKILFFMAGILLLLGLFTIELTTEGLEIKFFIAGIFL